MLFLLCLEKGNVPTVSAMPFIRQITTKISSFKEINYEKFSASNYTEHLLDLINEQDCFFYEMNLTNGNGNFYQFDHQNSLFDFLSSQIASVNSNKPRLSKHNTVVCH